MASGRDLSSIFSVTKLFGSATAEVFTAEGSACRWCCKYVLQQSMRVILWPSFSCGKQKICITSEPSGRWETCPSCLLQTPPGNGHAFLSIFFPREFSSGQLCLAVCAIFIRRNLRSQLEPLHVTVTQVRGTEMQNGISWYCIMQIFITAIHAIINFYVLNPFCILC